MKKWVIFLTAAVLVQSFVIADALDNKPKIHSELSRQIVMSQSNNSEDMIRVIVIMKEQYQAPEVKVQGHVDQKQHRMDTVNSLKQKSARSQHNLISVMQGKGADKMKNARPLWILNAITFEATPDVIEELANRDDVAQVIPDYEVHLLEESVVVDDVDDVAVLANLVWGVEKINAPRVWDLIYNGTNINGTGVNVSIIDTGINYNHPDLESNYIGGYDFVNDDDEPMDDNWHGTHVAGTVAGTGVGGKKTGVAPGSNIFGVKVLNESGSGSYSDLIDGVQWSIDNGADIVSLSLGGPNDSSMTTMINNIIDAGVLPVIAAGNDGPGVSTIKCPGDEFNATTVGSTDSSDTIAPYSSRGPVTWIGDKYIKPDVTAPGVKIKSTSYHGGYYIKSGTSMATPHVSGAAALILQAFPDMTPLEVRQLLEDTAVDLGDAGKDNTYGSGRIDVLKAISIQPPAVSNVSINPNLTNTDPVLNASISDLFNNISYADYFIDYDLENSTFLSAVDGSFDSSFENVTRIINISRLPDGVHSITTRVKDSMNNWNNQTNASFTVDTTAPTSTTPSTTEFFANTSASFDKWVLTDLYPGYYWVLRNGTEIVVPPTPWTNNTNITVPIDTNISLGDFNYTIQYNDTAGNNGTQNTVMITIITISDTNSPILSDNMPLSGTTNKTPTISINATDRGSGINASSANMTVNDIQVLLSNISSGFTFNFTNTTTVAYNHGDTVNVTFNVSDYEGHLNSTSWMFYIDNVAPTITITSPAEGYSTTASSVKVTCIVNGTGSPPTVTVNSVTAVTTTNSTVFNGTFSATASLFEGSNQIYANVTDAAGNTNSTLINVTRTKSTSSGGGGGGGGGTSGEDFYNIAETETQRVPIFKGDIVSYLFENTQIPIQNIKFTAKVSAGKVASKIELLRNTSTTVDTPAPGKVYQNINIWVGNYGWATEKNIRDMTISFTVPLDWINSNNIEKSSIVLYRYNDDSWERLPTSETTRNENSITFTSSTPGFSPFAISSETISTPTAIPKAHDTPASMATHSSNITSSSQTNVNELGNKEGTIMLWVLFIIVILAVAVIIFLKKDEILQGINNMRQQRGR
ncbi:MAG: S8 family serine peptidase [ANME-2 cluster archaeon]|nr:S8 family serine peptidase [ANME-2 cluster archaeon]MBC2701794.1 S8 family serine peptidase [ANME-2 cluster archaeon]MBC2706510.1 S8 family serine peptidase [ANME-2 cluster archaeon]MBC2745855.1 S8 family serine peptidase [ANME-2 cluster archaeon]MBC2762002.1 S8 family serine peptidase [ANME-2 cluster archaeon]